MHMCVWVYCWKIPPAAVYKCTLLFYKTITKTRKCYTAFCYHLLYHYMYKFIILYILLTWCSVCVCVRAHVKHLECNNKNVTQQVLMNKHIMRRKKLVLYGAEAKELPCRSLILLCACNNNNEKSLRARYLFKCTFFLRLSCTHTHTYHP